MPNDAPGRLKRLGGLPVWPGYIVEILEVNGHSARVQFSLDGGHKFGSTTAWYDLDKFSPDLFAIDDRDPTVDPSKLPSQKRATELLDGDGKIRATDKPEIVLDVARKAHQRLKSGSDSA